MKYTVYNSNGDVVQSGFARTPPKVDNVETFVLLGDAPPDNDLYAVHNDKIVKRADYDEITLERHWISFRSRRNSLLKSTDWTQLPDAGRNRQAWAQYRQALRDLPQNTTDPRNPTWPQKPNE